MQSLVILRRIAWSLEGLKVYLQSFNPSKDHAIIWLVEGLHMVLQPFDGLHSQSVRGLKDCIFNPSKGRGITRSPWKGWRISYIVLRRVEGLHAESFEGLKDCMKSPSKGWRVEGLCVILQPFEWSCDLSTLQRITSKGQMITLMLLGRVKGSHS